MADINKLAVLQDAIVSNIDLSTNALVVQSLKLGANELTELILGNLINLQNGSDFADGNSSHTHDARYRTQAELSSVGATSGGDLIGIRDDGAYYTGSDVEDILQEIGLALTATVSADSITFNPATSSLVSTDVQAMGEEIAGRLDTVEGQASANAAAVATKAEDADVIKKDGSVAFEGNQAMGDNRLTGLGAPVNPNDAVRLVDLEAVQAGGLGKSAADAASTANLSGYNGAGGSAGNGEFTGVSMTQDGVVLVNGSRLLVWQQTNLSENGIYVVTDAGTGTLERAADADGSPAAEVQGGNSIFVNAGTAYANTVFQLKGTGNISPDNDDQDWIIYSRVENIQAAQGLTRSGTQMSVDTDNDSLGFDGSDQLEVKFSGSTIEKDGSGIKVADSGIGTTQLADDAVTKEKIAADVAGAGIGQNVDGSLEANVDDSTIEIATDTIQVKDGGITDAKVASGSNLEEAVNFHAATDISGAEAEQLTDGSNADNLHEHGVNNNVRLAGEAFGANISKIVRFGLNGETAGRLYAATNANAIVDKRFRGMGIALSTSAVSAGTNIKMVTHGVHTLGSGDTNFNAADIGLPVYLTTNGDFSITPPTADLTAVYEIGVVEDINKIFVNPRLIGVN